MYEPGDGLDSTSLLGTEDASRQFRKAERRRDRIRTHYAYPPSPTSPVSPDDSPSHSKPIPLSQRLRHLQAELTALETELSDPTNPQLSKEREEDNVDPGELIRGLVDVRSRLEKIKKGKQGRGRLVGLVLANDDKQTRPPKPSQKDNNADDLKPLTLVEMDRRVGSLEKLVGSSTAALDELSPLPPPLLPQISRLNSQMTLLTQPRHIDSISRRLKLLLSDLERTSAHKQPSHMQDQILPLLTRLGPLLPQIPHILTRLRTLSTLHTCAAESEKTLETLEQEETRLKEALNVLEAAVKDVEESMAENRNLVRGNIEGLEKRVDGLLRRLEG